MPRRSQSVADGGHGARSGAVRGPARGYVVDYDPLSDIDITSDAATGAIESIVEVIVIPEQGTGAHFSESAAAILAGVIEAVLIHEDRANQTLKHCRNLILRRMQTRRGISVRCHAGKLVEDGASVALQEGVLGLSSLLELLP